MLDAMWAGLEQILTIQVIVLILLGIPIGCFFGAVPGLGGKLALAVFIPFVYGMDPIPGFAFLLSMHAVVHTAGQYPSIMFGIPGTGPDAATIVDGYPMAQKGEAGRAIGASLMASGIGGLIGALLMALVIPIVRPVVLSFSPSEFFMMAVFGITLISMVSGKLLMKGLIVGTLGLALSYVGMDPQTGVIRFGFGQIFLWGGLDLISAVVGVFALAEMVSLGVKGGSIAKTKPVSGFTFKGVFEGMLDVPRNWFLSLRCSIIGFLIGVVPGLGGDAATWICYGHAVQTSKDPDSFGKGNVQGVIAPECANNSKEGGALIPTIAFGIPGSSGMAVLLGAFLILGLQPGPMILIDHLDLVWSMVWVLAFANVIAVIMLLSITKWAAQLTFIRGNLIIPIVLILVLIGSFLSMRAWQTMIIAVLFGFLGYAMKKYDYPRPPLLMGLILGKMAETNLHKSITLWGLGFLTRPFTFILLVLCVISILYPVYKWFRAKEVKSL